MVTTKPKTKYLYMLKGVYFGELSTSLHPNIKQPKEAILFYAKDNFIGVDSLDLYRVTIKEPITKTNLCNIFNNKLSAFEIKDKLFCCEAGCITKDKINVQRI